ncbi:DoxX family protein [Isoptericola sp. NEAU-Y5]|uniref:DoxX family protein n=1 Tax=Isoptericola luteus TaxID=2879484 RepID=A0ABS7Z9M8_9MICO|nr:DoxX family protein [Isoptericola sp. NEAU-Y5]MCA5891751.1 DoxX family protein [Isoptericola sp. NEAU-Y5]MCA5894584.1 DoxX family protein [Isoptericola sp. NEAU-Y5]
MNLALWILAGALAIAYTAGGTSLLLMPKERYRALGASQHWVDDFEDRHLKVIGVVKIIGSLGLILPAALGVAPLLTPLAASGLALFMAGAATTRFRRSEWKLMLIDVFYLSLFLVLAWGRFDLQPL